MFENRKCGKCGQLGTSRNVQHEVLDVYRCRGCANEFQRTTTRSFSDREGLILNELSSINDWLSKLRSGGHEIVEVEKDREWTIDECELLYDHGRPGYMDLRFSTTVRGALISKVENQYEKLDLICASHGLQASHIKGSSD